MVLSLALSDTAQRNLARNEAALERFFCFLRRIWAPKVSFFGPRPRDVAHPGSGPAQDWLRTGSGFAQLAQALLSLTTISARLRRSIQSYFNSSRASPELVPYIKMAKLAPSVERECSAFT